MRVLVARRASMKNGKRSAPHSLAHSKVYYSTVHTYTAYGFTYTAYTVQVFIQSTRLGTHTF